MFTSLASLLVLTSAALALPTGVTGPSLMTSPMSAYSPAEGGLVERALIACTAKTNFVCVRKMEPVAGAKAECKSNYCAYTCLNGGRYNPRTKACMPKSPPQVYTLEEDVRQYLLVEHNKERAAYNSPALVRDAALERLATSMVQFIKNNTGPSEVQHTLPAFIGFNAATTGYAPGSSMTGLQNVPEVWQRWSGARTYYDPENPVQPAPYTYPDFWTNIVWKSTTKIGCAITPTVNDYGYIVQGYAYVCLYESRGTIGDAANYHANIQVPPAAST